MIDSQRNSHMPTNINMLFYEKQFCATQKVFPETRFYDPITFKHRIS